MDFSGGFCYGGTMQDIIFSVGSLIFIFALLPMLKMPWDQKPAVFSALTTALVLTVFGFTYATIDFKFASVTTFITAGLWYTLAWQKAYPSGHPDSYL